ncbi:disease resistance protein RGA2-like [Pyrus ussuriensis x Pyrus communis]|uniref:Disease resistance protein RGA2-like n=1 Tax=Pyrus ussuriensis x Pyrus communis TaxID=2448454 RepID=A0A5N5IHU7_9ROSA|nr:disease resistance protein RGA2-like [Pyrus ussuriensis x Pyrus communis]
MMTTLQFMWEAKSLLGSLEVTIFHFVMHLKATMIVMFMMLPTKNVRFYSKNFGKQTVESYTVLTDKVRKILQKLEVIVAEGSSKLKIREPTQPRSDRQSDKRETSSFIDSRIYGRDDDKETLGYTYASCIPIIGIGGIGKTTLAQLAYNDKVIIQHFDVKMWIFVSSDFNVKKIMKTIIASITNDECKLSEIELLQSRIWQLLQNKRYLIVLDDVWTEDQDDWDKLRPLFREGIPFMMDFPNSPMYLSGLTDDDCWALFKQRAFGRGEEENYPNLSLIGKQIVRKCGGVPLAAKSLGSSMRLKRDEKQWLSMRDCELWKLDEKQHKEKLIHMWMASSLILQDGSRRPEDIADEYFAGLLWLSFFQEMNDVIHDLAQYVAGNESLMLEHSAAQIRHASVIYQYKAIGIPKDLLEAKHLRTLLLIGESGLLNNRSKMFSSFGYLRLLDLSSCGLICLRYLDLSYTPIFELPHSTRNLCSLQTLNLFGCRNLIRLPSLVKMISLRHLNLIGCVSLASMPLEIGKLRKLQTLPLFVVNRIPMALGALKRLNLYGKLNVTRLENARYGADAESAGLKLKENLESLGLYWGPCSGFEDSQESFGKSEARHEEFSFGYQTMTGQRDTVEKILEGLEPHQNLKKLIINGYPGIRFPQWALPNLVAINFTNCTNCEHLPALGNLLLLKTLSLHRMHGVKRIGVELYGDGMDVWFPSLEELLISDFPNLEEWSNANGGSAFSRLKKLTVKRCPKLAHMPLPQFLEHLELRDCNPTMTSISSLSLLSVLVLEKIPNLFSLPEGLFASASLSSLKILSCPKLRSVPLEIGTLTALKSLTISWCDELSYLPQSLQNLKSLESLEISDCHSLISMPNGGIASLSSLRTLSIENCSNLTFLSSSLEHLKFLEHLTIMYCPKLGSFPEGVQHLSSLRSFTILNCPWFDTLPIGLMNLQTLHCLEISSCPNLDALPDWLENLASLRSLTISDCPNSRVLPPGLKYLKELQHLSIQECPELEERCKQGSGEDWLKIAHVPHKYIGSPDQAMQSDKASTSSSSSF